MVNTGFHKPVAGIIPGVMSLALVGRSAKMAEDSLKGKAKHGDFIKGSVELLIGIPLLGAVAGSVSGL